MVPKIRDMYNDMVKGTSENMPLTADEVNMIAKQLILFADPHLIKIIEKDDRFVGFLFAYPDISAAIQATNGQLYPFGWFQLYREMKRTNWVNINAICNLNSIFCFIESIYGFATRWQATQWSGVISRHSGISTLHRSTAIGQRGWNLQPLGGLIGLGISPIKTEGCLSRLRFGSGMGTAESNACVYGCKGFSYNSLRSATSPI